MTPRFLVLDDNEDTRLLTRHALRKAFPGCIVNECATIVDALAAADGAKPDGIVTDHHLAEGNGADFVQQLRSRGVACPIVMVTSSFDPKVYERARHAGAAHVFAGDDRDFVGFFRRILHR